MSVQQSPHSGEVVGDDLLEADRVQRVRDVGEHVGDVQRPRLIFTSNRKSFSPGGPLLRHY